MAFMLLPEQLFDKEFLTVDFLLNGFLASGLDQRIVPDQIEMPFYIHGIHPFRLHQDPWQPGGVVIIISFNEIKTVIFYDRQAEDESPYITSDPEPLCHERRTVHHAG